MTLKGNGEQNKESMSCSQTQEEWCCPDHLLLGMSRGQV